MLISLHYNNVSFSSDAGFAPGVTQFATPPRLKFTVHTGVAFLICESQVILDNYAIFSANTSDEGNIFGDFIFS